MEQRPVDGHDPLSPPTADVAQAYLDELSAVRSRREKYVDRRGLAAFTLISAVVLAVYVTLGVFAIGVTAANMLFLVFVALFLLWLQLSTEYRENLGTLGPSISSSRKITVAVVAVLIVAIIGAFVLSVTGAQLPTIARFIPGAIVLLVMGIPAVRDFRRAVPRDVQVARRRLAVPERWATIGIGVIIAACLSVLAAGVDLLVAGLGFVLMCGNLVWLIAVRVSERLPVLGAVWAWPQWSAFALGGVAVTAVISAQLLGLSASIATFAPLAAAVILLAFIGSAFLDGRDG